MGGVSSETRLILRGISEDDWRRHYRELAVYARARCQRWVWRTGGRENLPEGYSPDAIAREAIARLYDGTRVWNHDQYPGGDPVPFLKAVIDSLIWGLLSGAEHKRTITLDEGNPDRAEDQPQNFDGLEQGAGLYQASTLTPDDKIYLEEMEKRIRAAIADSRELVEFFEHLAEGLKPSEIAARMNTDVKRVYVLRKTFDRRTAEIQRELFGVAEQRQEAKKEGR